VIPPSFRFVFSIVSLVLFALGLPAHAVELVSAEQQLPRDMIRIHVHAARENSPGGVPGARMRVTRGGGALTGITNTGTTKPGSRHPSRSPKLQATGAAAVSIPRQPGEARQPVAFDQPGGVRRQLISEA